jgi:hypothetical protein
MTDGLVPENSSAGGTGATATPASDAKSMSYALYHVWSWFVLHAGQRLQMLNFWLISMAFLVGAYVAALGSGRSFLSFAIAMAGAAISFCFHRLERRTRQLVQIGEQALMKFQDEMAVSTGFEELRLSKEAERIRGHFASYGRVILAMQWLSILGFLAAGSVALAR